MLVGTVNKGVIQAVQYAKSLAPERLIAVSVVTDAEEQEQLAKAWADNDMPIELHTIASPYRDLTRPVLDYLDELDAESPDDIITVVIPEFVTQWKTQWLHNQSAFALKARLLYRPNTVVTSVPVLVGRSRSSRRSGRGQNGGDAVLEAALAGQAARRTSSTCASVTRCARSSTCPAWPRAPRAR